MLNKNEVEPIINNIQSNNPKCDKDTLLNFLINTDLDTYDLVFHNDSDETFNTRINNLDELSNFINKHSNQDGTYLAILDNGPFCNVTVSNINVKPIIIFTFEQQNLKNIEEPTVETTDEEPNVETTEEEPSVETTEEEPSVETTEESSVENTEERKQIKKPPRPTDEIRKKLLFQDAPDNIQIEDEVLSNIQENSPRERTKPTYTPSQQSNISNNELLIDELKERLKERDELKERLKERINPTWKDSPAEKEVPTEEISQAEEVPSIERPLPPRPNEFERQRAQMGLVPRIDGGKQKKRKNKSTKKNKRKNKGTKKNKRKIKKKATKSKK